MEQVCTMCKVSKPLLQFGKQMTRKNGYRAKCKECRKIESKLYYASQDKDKRAAYDAIRYKENKVHIAESNRKWKLNNYARRRLHKANRRARELNATPVYADMLAISRIYRTAHIMSKLGKKNYHVDHIIPLQGKRVSGFHIESNLQILEAGANMAKGNRY